jgi:hypothetical protein
MMLKGSSHAREANTLDPASGSLSRSAFFQTIPIFLKFLIIPTLFSIHG